jgi:hypothetical protein
VLVWKIASAFVLRCCPRIDRRHVALDSRGVGVPGPGGRPGTASGFTQFAMAIIVYGTSALVVGGGLISAMRRR